VSWRKSVRLEFGRPANTKVVKLLFIDSLLDILHQRDRAGVEIKLAILLVEALGKVFNVTPPLFGG